jgi:hypothetical protein
MLLLKALLVVGICIDIWPNMLTMLPIEGQSKKWIAQGYPDQRRDPRWLGPCIDVTETLFGHPVSEECNLVRPIA